MKVIETISSDKFSEEHDYRSLLRIQIENGRKMEFYDGELEDANLSRDFNDCYLIIDFMKLAYEAGKNGEEFIIETKEIDDWE